MLQTLKQAASGTPYLPTEAAGGALEQPGLYTPGACVKDGPSIVHSGSETFKLANTSWGALRWSPQAAGAPAGEAAVPSQGSVLLGKALRFSGEQAPQ